MWGQFTILSKIIKQEDKLKNMFINTYKEQTNSQLLFSSKKLAETINERSATLEVVETDENADFWTHSSAFGSFVKGVNEKDGWVKIIYSNKNELEKVVGSNNCGRFIKLKVCAKNI